MIPLNGPAVIPLIPPTLFLAPMEGVMDSVMREVVTSSNAQAFAYCVSEFIRVTDQKLPPSVFHKYCPELKNQSRTKTGTPLLVQLLGGKASPLAENAAQACDLGAYGIDLNFGCPAPTVNRHDGGATLLKYPDRISEIVSAVRKSVPDKITVSAKIRLGFDDPRACLENAQRIQDAGASWLTVHCRTKTDNYKPPAHWEWIPKIRQQIQIPIVVNGEIWNTEDFENCRRQTKENRFMIGRGILASPFLGEQIHHQKDAFLHHSKVAALLSEFARLSQERYADSQSKPHPGTARRLKQWIRFLAMKSAFYQELFQEIKILESSDDILRKVHNFEIHPPVQLVQ